MAAVLVLSHGCRDALEVSHHSASGRICIEAPLFTLSMTVDEARALATKLQNAAVQATALVELEDAA